jgi:hypothetical protein
MKRAVSSKLMRLENDSEMATDRGALQIEAPLQPPASPDPINSESTDGLVAQIRELQTCTLRILRRAEAAGRTDTALKVIREIRSNMELLARLTGRLDQPEQLVTAVVIMPGPSAHPEDCVDLVGGSGQVIDIELAR